MLLTEEKILVEFLEICLKKSIGERKQMILTLLADYYNEMSQNAKGAKIESCICQQKGECFGCRHTRKP